MDLWVTEEFANSYVQGKAQEAGVFPDLWSARIDNGSLIIWACPVQGTAPCTVISGKIPLSTVKALFGQMIHHITNGGSGT